MINKQKGFGMVEVAVSVLVLGLGLLGAISVTTKSTQIAHDSQRLVQASIFAKDILESITAIPFTNMQTASTMKTLDDQTWLDENCDFAPSTPTQGCSKEQMVQYLTNIRYQTMDHQGIQAQVIACPMNYTITKNCVIVSWGETTPTLGTGQNDCATLSTDVILPNRNANCLVVEGY